MDKKERQFIDSLKFLEEQYDFIYESINTNLTKKYSYKNKAGEIAYSIIIEQMDCITELYVSIGGWKTVINVNYEYSKLDKKRKLKDTLFGTLYFKKVAAIIKNQIESTGKIYGLNIINKFI